MAHNKFLFVIYDLYFGHFGYPSAVVIAYIVKESEESKPLTTPQKRIKLYTISIVYTYWARNV